MHTFVGEHYIEISMKVDIFLSKLINKNKSRLMDATVLGARLYFQY